MSSPQARPADFDNYIHRESPSRLKATLNALMGRPPVSACGHSLELLPGETGAPADAPECPNCK